MRIVKETCYKIKSFKDTWLTPKALSQTKTLQGIAVFCWKVMIQVWINKLIDEIQEKTCIYFF